MSEKLKQLTGKNKKDYETAAYSLVNAPDEELFEELVEKDNFLFDFIKENVAKRLSQQVNNSNYRNLIGLLKYYSPSYEDFLVLSLVKFADEELTDKMLDLLENGTENEKTYAAKYFCYIQDSLAVEFLNKNAFSDNENLMINCALTLSAMKEREAFDIAVQKLYSQDDFEVYKAVKFLTAYGDKSILPDILKVMKKSAVAENIACEIPYLSDFFELMDYNYTDMLFVLNYVINGLGEISGLSIVFDFELYEVFEKIINDYNDSKTAVVLLNAAEKFEILTENDEYLFDEDKETKNEVLDIKKLLNGINKKEMYKLVNDELKEDSPFVFTALEFAKDVYAIRELLKSDNQTLILKTVEVLKNLGNLDESTKTVALLKVSDTNIKSVIRAL